MLDCVKTALVTPQGQQTYLLTAVSMQGGYFEIFCFTKNVDRMPQMQYVQARPSQYLVNK